MLELQHVSYDVNDEGGNKEILKDISLTIGDGDFLVVTGRRKIFPCQGYYGYK